MEAIRQAIIEGARAGKLRAYEREHGGGLAGLLRLADRHSGLSAKWIERAVEMAAARE